MSHTYGQPTGEHHGTVGHPVRHHRRRLPGARWTGGRSLHGDLTKEVAELKARPGRELQVHGSGELIGSLLAANLVDTLDILTFPVLLGTGKRLFPENSHPAAFTLAETRVTTKGVLIATYRKDGAPTYGEFGSDQ
ncbi:dihydrofolate reductase family protein [Nocardia tengchongensis]|uniref:dihydrofolate reductase family protein n=1 Tax=Nocardia tengchongensis TaxID=2055889 RepID=UPI0036AE56CF